MYPDPDIESKHTVVPLNATGDAIGQLLTNDPELQRLAVVHGFRTANPGAFNNFVQQNHVTVDSQLFNIVEPPTYETLEALINALDDQLHRTFGANVPGSGVPSTDVNASSIITRGTGNP